MDMYNDASRIIDSNFDGALLFSIPACKPSALQACVCSQTRG